MSAFIVSDEHLNYLVNFAFQKEICVFFDGITMEGKKRPQEFFNILYRQNIRSVNERYSETNSMPPVQWVRSAQNWDLVQVLKACDCYDYQACETDDYRETMAHKIINAIRGEAICGLPGYEKAAWEIRENVEARP